VDAVSTADGGGGAAPFGLKKVADRVGFDRPAGPIEGFEADIARGALLARPWAWVLTHPVRQEKSVDAGGVKYGGQGGIRTHGNLSATHGFQPCSLNHSDTCPRLSSGGA
jgi:hypothetical protein